MSHCVTKYNFLFGFAFVAYVSAGCFSEFARRGLGDTVHWLSSLTDHTTFFVFASSNNLSCTGSSRFSVPGKSVNKDTLDNNVTCMSLNEFILLFSISTVEFIPSTSNRVNPKPWFPCWLTDVCWKPRKETLMERQFPFRELNRWIVNPVYFQ